MRFWEKFRAAVSAPEANEKNKTIVLIDKLSGILWVPKSGTLRLEIPCFLLYRGRYAFLSVLIEDVMTSGEFAITSEIEITNDALGGGALTLVFDNDWPAGNHVYAMVFLGT